jgi:carbon storage regulator
MLILSRKLNESLVIGGKGSSKQMIIITVLGIEKDKVKLGIAAPREVVVLRQELWQASQNQAGENQAGVGKNGNIDRSSQ